MNSSSGSGTSPKRSPRSSPAAKKKEDATTGTNNNHNNNNLPMTTPQSSSTTTTTTGVIRLDDNVNVDSFPVESTVKTTNVTVQPTTANSRDTLFAHLLENNNDNTHNNHHSGSDGYNKNNNNNSKINLVVWFVKTVWEGIWISLFHDVAHGVLGLSSTLASVAATTVAVAWISASSSSSTFVTVNQPDTTTTTTLLALYVLTKVHVLTTLGASHWPPWTSSSFATQAAHGAGPALLATQTLTRWTIPIVWQNSRRELTSTTSTTTTFDDNQEVDMENDETKHKHLFSTTTTTTTGSTVLLAVWTSLFVLAMLYGPVVASGLVMMVVILLTSGIFVHYNGNEASVVAVSSAVTEILVLLVLQRLQEVYGAPGQGLLTFDGSFSRHAQSTATNLRHWDVPALVQSWMEAILVPLTCSQDDPHLVVLEEGEEGWVAAVALSFSQNIGRVTTLTKTLLHVDPNGWMGILLRLGLVIVWTILSYAWMGRSLIHRKKTDMSGSLSPNDESEGDESSWGGAVDEVTASVQFRRAKVNQILKRPAVSFEEKYTAVQEYLDSLAKPVGALGTLEDWAARLASLQGTLSPVISNNDSAVCLIFAGDHGVARAVRDGGAACSAFPQSATRTMLAGLEAQVAASSILAKRHNVTVRVIDVGVDGEPYNGTVVQSSPDKIVGGTRNFLMDAAMSMKELERCLAIGRNQAKKWGTDRNVKVIALGEVGIGNTTSSSALIAALTKSYPKAVCGVGAMRSHKVDSTMIDKKIEIVRKALQKHCSGLTRPSPKEICARLGGAEIAAMVGVMLEASERKIAVLIDGFIVTAAALVAAHLQPTSIRSMFFCSRSKEPGQAVALQSICDIASKNRLRVPSRPALDIDLRQGGGAGAILGTTLLRDASSILCNMATLQQIPEK